MKRFTPALLILTAVCMMALVSCEDEKEPVGTMFSGFMTGYTDSEGYMTVLNDDFGKQYMVREKSDKLRPDTMYRIVATVELDENKTALIHQMIPALSYVAPESSEIPDSMRVKDPVQIESAYIGGGYLNVNVIIKVKKEATKHSFRYAHLNIPGRTEFTFYHNAYGDEPVYSKRAYVSIPLFGYGLTTNSKVFLSCKGYEEDYAIQLTYK